MIFNAVYTQVGSSGDGLGADRRDLQAVEDAPGLSQTSATSVFITYFVDNTLKTS